MGNDGERDGEVDGGGEGMNAATKARMERQHPRHQGAGDYDPGKWLVTFGGEASPYECMGHSLFHDCWVKDVGEEERKELEVSCEDGFDCDHCGEPEDMDYRKRQFSKRPGRLAAARAVLRKGNDSAWGPIDMGHSYECGPRKGEYLKASEPITIWPPYASCHDDQRYSGQDSFVILPAPGDKGAVFLTDSKGNYEVEGLKVSRYQLMKGVGA